jgi:hypothetical protein
MARPKSNGPYAPLSATYYRDDLILAAGEQAELLFVRCLAFLADSASDGYITDRQMRLVVGMGMRNVPARCARLVELGLVTCIDGAYLVRSWGKWNKSTDEIGKHLKRDRERKQREVGANSARNPDGIQTDSSLLITTNQITTNQITTTPKGVVPRKRGTRISEQFIVTAEMREWAATRTPGVDVNSSTEKFVNYWRSKTRDATKLDWVATWHNWLISDLERVASKPTPEQRARATLALATDIDMREIEQ